MTTVVKNVASVHIDSIETESGESVTMPTSGGELTTKEYVDSIIAGIHIPDIAVGTVTTGLPGTDSDASMDTDENGDKTLNLTISRGSTVTVGSVSTGTPGTNASVSNSGANGDVILNLAIPAGLTGNPYKSYATLAAANADLANIPADALVWINADTTHANIGYWAKTGGVLVQSPYDRVTELSDEVAALGVMIRDEYTEEDYAYTIRDASGNVAIGIKADGTVVMVDMEATNINGLAISAVIAALTSDVTALQNEEAVTAISAITGVPPVFTINDAAGRTAFEILADGTVRVAALSAPTVNGGYAQSLLRANFGGGTYDAEITYFTNSGQSLAGGPLLAETKTQEYDNVGFAAGAVSPVAFLPLTAANCSATGDNEPPVFGALGSLKELILRENGIDFTSQLYKLVGTDNSHGSWAISALSKGTQYYNAAMSQATVAKTLATAENKTFAVGGVFWSQGEADALNGYSYYLGKLKTLASDYNTDFKAITGQTKDIHLITYQVGSTVANKDVALAQLQASLESALIHLACPMYQFDYASDGVHIVPDSSKWLGGYYGLVYKRVAIDGLTWTPTRPVSSVVSGKFANVKFNLMAKPLVIDTVLIPAQTNYGFTLVDSSNNPLTIDSVAVSGPDTVKITAASAIPAGAKLRYGFNSATGKGGYVSGCGNLRDSQGDIATYHRHPLHNWCVIFELSL